MKLNLVVATCASSRGIGLNGTLPWRIPEDLAFFAKLTSSVLNPENRNAVIMGRKTWDSIPVKFRPLPNRFNVVVSASVTSLPGALVAKSFDDAVRLASADRVENVFVIGGASIYEIALRSGLVERIYSTEVLKDFKCDTFLPPFDASEFERVKLPDISEEVRGGDVPFRINGFSKTGARSG